MKLNRNLLIKILLCISFVWLSYSIITDYLVFDRSFTGYVKELEAASEHFNDSNEIKSLIANCSLKPNHGAFHHWEDDSVLLTISIRNGECLKKSKPTIYSLLENEIINKIIVLKNGNILFRLKACARHYDCDDHYGGYHGDYVHFISKEPVFIPEHRWSKIKARRTFFNGWKYYVVWYAKG
jgi:hypothetical protein